MGCVRSRAAGPAWRWYRTLRYIEEHLNWPSSSFLLTFGGSAVLASHMFGLSSFGHVFSGTLSWIFTSSSVSTVILAAIDWLLKARAQGPSNLARSLRLAEWVVLPFAGLALSALPALIAHTRLLTGHHLE